MMSISMDTACAEECVVNVNSIKLSTCTLQTLGRWSSEAWKVYVDVDESMIRKAQTALSAAAKEQ